MQIDSLRIKKFCELTGWSESAVRTRINTGEWLDGREYIKVKGIIVISIQGYESWIQKSRESIPACLS